MKTALFIILGVIAIFVVIGLFQRSRKKTPPAPINDKPVPGPEPAGPNENDIEGDNPVTPLDPKDPENIVPEEKPDLKFYDNTISDLGSSNWAASNWNIEEPMEPPKVEPAPAKKAAPKKKTPAKKAPVKKAAPKKPSTEKKATTRKPREKQK